MSPRDCNPVSIGCYYESLTAKILYEQFLMVTFVAPTSDYDLQTLGGLKIEVKGGRGRKPSLKAAMSSSPSVDFYVIWRGDTPFVYSQEEARTNVMMEKRWKSKIIRAWFDKFQNNWSGIQDAEQECLARSQTATPTLESKGDSLKPINFYIDEAWLMELDAVIEADLWTTRSEFIRESVIEKLMRVGSFQSPLRKLNKLLKDFDKTYIEIWRDKEAVAQLLQEIEDLKGQLQPEYLGKVREIEKNAKLLRDAYVQVEGMPQETRIQQARKAMKLRETRNLAKLQGQNTTMLDQILEILEESAAPAKSFSNPVD